MSRSRTVALPWEPVDAGGADDLVIDYQPQVELTTGRMVGVEALVRRQAPDRGLLPPSTGAGDERGPGVEIDDLTFERACRQVVSWQLRHGLDLDLSVTMSAHQLGQPGFGNQVGDVLVRTHLDPRRLVVDLTRSALCDPSSEVARSLSVLRCSGVRVAIDDFGADHALIGHLRRLPVDVLKIDRSFVSGDRPGPAGEAMLDAIVDLAQRLGLDLVAQGIEETRQLTRLQELGCPVGQGSLLSRAVSAAVIDAMLRHHGSRPPERRGSAPDMQTA